MQAATKLVRQIRDALSGNVPHASAEALASEYARWCHEAGQRLESCAVMLANGSDYQALQLAETEPALLDLIATLSFADVPDWIAYCSSNGLPAPMRFDPKAVQALDGLYAKNISANHPLYKDYRAAATSRDASAAMRIIRLIVRLNPQDANAKSELARLEKKQSHLKIQELRIALASHDEQAILSCLSELERCSTSADPAEIPEYASAVQVRREAARREAISLASHLVDSMERERQSGAWRRVGHILIRLDMLQKEHRFRLAPQDADVYTEMHQYVAAQRAADEEDTRFQQALNHVSAIVHSVESSRFAPKAYSRDQAQNLAAELNQRWKEIEKFQRGVPEEFFQRVRASATELEAHVNRIQARRRLVLLSSCAAALLALLVAGAITVREMLANEYASLLADNRKAGQVEAAEKLSASLRSDHAFLVTKPVLRAKLDEIDHWTHDERGKLTEVESRLSELESIAKSGFPQTDPIALATKLDEVSRLTDLLASGLHVQSAARFANLRNQYDAYFATVRDGLASETDAELTSLEALAKESLSYEQRPENILAAISRLDASLKSLESRLKPAFASLALPPSQLVRAAALLNRTKSFQSEIDLLSKAHESLARASTLDEYLQALGSYKSSTLNGAVEVKSARKLLANFPKNEDLLLSLLMPSDPLGWTAAKTNVTPENMTLEVALCPVQTEVRPRKWIR